MRAIIYARVSTEEQKLFGYSLDGQIDVCKRYCEQQGWEIVGIYKEGISTRLEDRRPEFHRAITFMKEGGADVLVSWKLTRISRSNFEFQNLIRDVGFRFVLVEDGLDLTKENKKLEADIRIAFAEEERRNTSRATKLGLERARAQGKRLGRPRKIPDKDRKCIKTLRTRGFTYKEIAKKTGYSIWTVRSICEREKK